MLGSNPGLLRLRYRQSCRRSDHSVRSHPHLARSHPLGRSSQGNQRNRSFYEISPDYAYFQTSQETELFVRYTGLRKIGNWRLRRVEGSLVPGSRDRKRLTSNHPGWCGSGRARGRGLYCLLSLSLSPPTPIRRGGGGHLLLTLFPSSRVHVNHSSASHPEAGVLVRKLNQLTPLS
jgi:hypothetical protein